MGERTPPSIAKKLAESRDLTLHRFFAKAKMDRSVSLKLTQQVIWII